MTLSLGTKARERIEQAARALVRKVQRRSNRSSQSEQSLVLAVTNCHPTRVVLYAASFQSGWTVRFMKSLGEVADAASTERPKAVFYDQTAGDPDWPRYCSSLSREGVPFVSLAHKNDDDTFLMVLAAGGYQAWGEPLTSEGVMNAVGFAEEVSWLPRVPVKGY
jgi:hypothetical protein